MLIVKIYLQSGRTGETKEIGRMWIDNITGKGEGRYHKRADYRVRLLRRGKITDLRKVVQREGRVANFPRMSYSVWRLVFRALKSVLPEEK